MEKKQFFNSRLEKIFGERYRRVLAGMEHQRRVSLRVNTLRVSVDDCLAYFVSEGVEVERVGFFDNGFVVLNKSSRELTDLKKYQEGWFYLQSLSSMVPVWEVQKTLSKNTDSLQVLDMCAAPGSKTSQMSAVLNNTGHIDAFDVSRQRSYQLKANLDLFGVKNVDVHVGSSEAIWKKYGPVFDVVLLDAPCSGEGRWRGELDEDWSMEKIERLAQIQKRLLFGGIMCLKSGGVLIYSTCTFAPEENEAVVQFGLEKFEGAVEVEMCGENSDELLPFMHGLKEWKGKRFDERMDRCLRILPNDSWEGFFVCKMRRN